MKIKNPVCAATKTWQRQINKSFLKNYFKTFAIWVPMWSFLVSLPLSILLSLLSLVKMGYRSMLMGKERQSGSRGEEPFWGSLLRAKLWGLHTHRWQGCEHADKVQTQDPQGPVHRQWALNLGLSTHLFTCGSGSAGAKFWAQGPGFLPLPLSALPPTHCRAHRLFIWN